MTTVPQLRAARALLGWSQEDLAARSGVSKPTIARLELGSGELAGYARTRDKVVGALEAAGVTFLDDGETMDGGPGLRLRK
jgi:transcriptional regulator with XRE-family HTH domain